MKLRFAPSPTGFLHVGGARTAIFNFLHARRHGGTLLLRIEDTDVERSKQHHAEQIVASLQWLGVEWDEGPFYQSDRLERYRSRAEELIVSGAAFRCYSTVEELDSARQESEKAGKQYRYSGKCRDLPQADQAHVIRFRVPSEPIEFHDLIRGEVRFEGEQIDDFVLIRSDGYPTYHLSVVVDDIDMGITVVARGDDHLSNTPKHILLFRALGGAVPQFAHLPLILGTDKKRLSKRTGATSAEEYRDMGIVPAALFNFLTLLGWAPGGDLEIISKEDSADRFDLSQVNKSPAVFDTEKLLWMNAQHLARMTPEEVDLQLDPFLQLRRPSSRESWLEMIRLYQTRARTLKDLAAALTPYFAPDEELSYEVEAVNKHLRGVDLASRLSDLRATLDSAEPFDPVTTEKKVRELGQLKGSSAASYIHPMRLALTGRGASPPIFDVAVLIGKDTTLRRLDRLISMLPVLMASRDEAAAPGKAD